MGERRYRYIYTSGQHERGNLRYVIVRLQAADCRKGGITREKKVCAIRSFSLLSILPTADFDILSSHTCAEKNIPVDEERLREVALDANDLHQL